MLKNIIFDFDGVIINSHDVQIKALKESYREVCGNGTPPFDEFFKHCGDSLANIFSILGLPLDMIPIYQRISRENINNVKIFDGIIDMLEILKQNGYKCALCTGKDRFRTFELLMHLNLKSYFDIVVCSDDVRYPKPHPASLWYIMRELGGEKTESIMIGDGINDIRCAKNAGIKSIAVTWGNVNRELFLENPPEWFVDTVEQLLERILNE